MAIYVIGDVHGCSATLEALWARLPFSSKEDELWLAGDLVNRGPDSLGVLRWAMRKQESLGDRFRCVLGNHDLQLLSLAHGVGTPKAKDTLDEVLGTRGAAPFIDWLQQQPLLHRSDRVMMVHAGLQPAWSWSDAEKLAKKVAKALRSERAPKLLAAYERHAAGSGSTPYDSDLRGLSARARDLYVFTRLRTCDKRGVASPFSGPPRRAPRGFRPWFEHRGKKDGAEPGARAGKGIVFFGHWAALGLYLGKHHVGLDSGCVWGRRLTAVRWPDLKVFQQNSLDG